ncbi:MAG: hypothetical protein V4457_06185 [Pseudomonadota bacterium]
MPSIPIIEQHTLASQAGLPPGPNNISGSGLEALGRGIGAAGEAGTEGQLLAIKKQNEDAIADANDQLQQTRSEWIQRLTERKQSADPGAPDFTPSLLKDFDADAAQRLATAGTPTAKRYLQQRLADVRVGLYQDAVGFESQEATKHRLDQLTNAQGNAESAAEFHPENFSKLWGEQATAIDASGIDPAQRDTVSTASRYGLADAAVRGMIRRDPRGALKALNNEKSTDPALQALKFDDRERLRAQATIEVHRLDEQARIAQEKREADGERAVNEYYRQIATGVPATGVMQSAWQRRVNGTTSAPEFRQLLDGEQTVQTVLRRPPADQIAYVQQEGARLEAGGGDMKDIAFYTRLKTAVEKNVQTLTQSPLLYNAQRTGVDTAPIDLNNLSTPEGTQTIAAQIQERATTIAAMQKRFGSMVQNKPLLPQEASTLASLIDKGTPAQTAGLFGTLRNAAGSDETYRALIQQVAPDSPVKALAGLLAAKQRDLTLQRHWIGSDVVASSPDVARTLLEGDSLLNPGKDAKGQDGKPKASLYLPTDNTLQADFQDQVGTAFADRPGAAQIAFQAVQSYYVGKASQTGRLAANNKDIDSKILKEAITATLGTVVDYNGKGEVLAPWGMDSATFQTAVQNSYDQAVKSGQIKPLEVGQLGQLGLRNAGDGTYYVTAGRKYVADSRGRPVVLNVTP